MSDHMINKKIGIIDYGASNIFNLVSAFEYLNVNVKIIDEPQDMSEITHLVLPGVGAFENGMNSLKNKNLTDLKVLSKTTLEPVVNNLIKTNRTNFKGVGQPLRIGLVGSRFGSGIYDVILSLEKSEIIKRLSKHN